MRHQLKLCFLISAIIMSCSNPKIDFRKVHHEALVADLHCDTVMKLVRGSDIAVRDTANDIDLPRLVEGGVDLQVFACFTWTETPPDSARLIVEQMIDTLETQIARNPDRIEICKTAAEAERIVGDGKIAAFLAIENGILLGDRLDLLEHFYERGVRYLTLTHTSSSGWCISSADTTPAFDGLTDFGRQVIKKMNELGMIIDISHASPAAVKQVLALSSDPVIASHSCVHEICDHDRNLTDEQIRAIADKGGMIGVNFFQYYLSQRAKDIADSIESFYRADIDSAKALYPDDYQKRRKVLTHVHAALDTALVDAGVDVGTVADHIDHIVKLVGPDHVGLGSDFDGVSRMPADLLDCSMMPNITKELLARNYSRDDIEKILGGNFMRIFRRVCG